METGEIVNSERLDWQETGYRSPRRMTEYSESPFEDDLPSHDARLSWLDIRYEGALVENPVDAGWQ